MFVSSGSLLQQATPTWCGFWIIRFMLWCLPLHRRIFPRTRCANRLSRIRLVDQGAAVIGAFNFSGNLVVGVGLSQKGKSI